MTKKIIFSTGGTGGHILPAINLMKHFLDKKFNVLIVTDNKGSNFLKNYPNFKSYILKSSTPTNKNFLKKILSCFLILYSIIKSIIILKKEKPDLIFGFGGYVSFPVSLASKFFNIPLIIYENNMLLGRANRYLLPISKKILFTKEISENLPKKYKNKAYNVGDILNKNIINQQSYKKNDKNFSILVLGGSQGAEIFGTIIPTVVKMIKNSGCKVKINQQCLKIQKKLIENFYNENNIENYVFNFEKDILKLLLSSNLAITRCGAATTAELFHTRTPFIAIPLPNSIDNHQYLNAKYYEKKGCCLLLEQSNLNTQSLFNLIMETINKKNKLENICENMKKNNNENVYTNIEKIIKDYI